VHPCGFRSILSFTSLAARGSSTIIQWTAYGKRKSQKYHVTRLSKPIVNQCDFAYFKCGSLYQTLYLHGSKK